MHNALSWGFLRPKIAENALFNPMVTLYTLKLRPLDKSFLRGPFE